MIRRRVAIALAVTVAVAGCGGAASTAPSSLSPGSTGTTAASPTLQAAGTPNPTVDGAALAAKFVSIVTDPELHVTVTQDLTGEATLNGRPFTMRVTATIALALPDLTVEMVNELGGQEEATAVIVSGDTTFLRREDGSWAAAPLGYLDRSALVAQFAIVTDPADLSYAGPEVVDGRELHHLVANRRLEYTPGALQSGGGTATLDDFDLYVEADGTPVRIDLSFNDERTTMAGEDIMTGTARIVFRDVGGDQVIVAPSLAP